MAILSLQRGEYSEPPHLSPECKDLLRRMLNVNPLCRILTKQMLDHPWICHGYDEPATCEPENYKQEEDKECVETMANHYGIPFTAMASQISKWLYDYATATYLLLLGKKKRREPLRMYEATTPDQLHNQVCIDLLILKRGIDLMLL